MKLAHYRRGGRLRRGAAHPVAAADPVFGPASIRLANGTTQPNPLATRLRFQGPTRGDGQIRNEDEKYLNRPHLQVGDQIEPSANIFNLNQ